MPMFAIHRRTQVLGRATAAILSVALITATYAALIPAGPNYFETDPTGTSIDFSHTSIPGNFFDSGSDSLPWVSSACKATRVEPSGPLVQPDTIMQRVFDIEISQNGPPKTISLEIAAVSLVAVNPITVTHNGGQNPELWDARVSLQPNQEQRGRMTVIPDERRWRHV